MATALFYVVIAANPFFPEQRDRYFVRTAVGCSIETKDRQNGMDKVYDKFLDKRKREQNNGKKPWRTWIVDGGRSDGWSQRHADAQ